MNVKRVTPQHVAIIMDGNGRWAKQRGKERYEGHLAGVEPVRAAVRAAVRNGVKWLTLYAFSTENWGRPIAEVEAIMELFCRTVVGEGDDLARQGVRVKIMGERTNFSPAVLEMIEQIESVTREGNRLTLVLAFNYSARREILLATQHIAHQHHPQHTNQCKDKLLVISQQGCDLIFISSIDHSDRIAKQCIIPIPIKSKPMQHYPQQNR
jgi:undecaprenyl diphosphate synthase